MTRVPDRAVTAALLIVVGLPLVGYGQALPPDPAEGAPMQFGPFSFRPAFELKNVGPDSNVFNDPENPRQDFSATIAPALEVIARSGPARVIYHARLDYVWFQTYSSERSTNSASDARVELRFARLVPFVSGSLIRTRERPNAEIDLRAERRQTHWATGAAMVLGPTSVLAAAFRRHSADYASDQVFDGVPLEQQLDNELRAADAELRLDLTALTTLSLKGTWERQEFPLNPQRDSRSFIISPGLEFSPSALIAGKLVLGYRSFDPVDPLLPDFNGLIAQADLSYLLGATTRIQGRFSRDVAYSFEPEHPYYLATGGQVTITQQIAGPFDVQALAGRQRLNYQSRGATEAPRLTTDTYGGGAGVRIGDRSRLGVTVEATRRRGGEGLRGREYDRTRVLGSFTYGF